MCTCMRKQKTYIYAVNYEINSLVLPEGGNKRKIGRRNKAKFLNDDYKKFSQSTKKTFIAMSFQLRYIEFLFHNYLFYNTYTTLITWGSIPGWVISKTQKKKKKKKKKKKSTWYCLA